MQVVLHSVMLLQTTMKGCEPLVSRTLSIVFIVNKM
jgi:hypothetical protein